MKLANRKINTFRKRDSRDRLKKLGSPEKKVNQLLKNQKVTSDVRKQLLFGEVLQKQIETSFKGEKKRKEKRGFAQKIAGYIMKKYKYLNKCKTILSKRSVESYKSKLTSKLNQLEKERKVVEFLESDENSRMMPGKRDTITKNKSKKQKRLLNGTLKKLFKKFRTDNPGLKMSYSYFSKVRPFWVLEPEVGKRDTCMCIMHENFSLLVRKLNCLNIIEEKSPDDLINSITCENLTEACLERKCVKCSAKKIILLEYDEEEKTNYEKWITKKVPQIVKGVEKMCQKTFKDTIELTKKELVAELNKNLNKFLQHVSNISHQNDTIKELKKNLTDRDVIVHMDFSENYGCKYTTEVLFSSLIKYN